MKNSKVWNWSQTVTFIFRPIIRVLNLCIYIYIYLAVIVAESGREEMAEYKERSRRILFGLCCKRWVSSLVFWKFSSYRIGSDRIRSEFCEFGSKEFYLVICGDAAMVGKSERRRSCSDQDRYVVVPEDFSGILMPGGTVLLFVLLEPFFPPVDFVH